VLRIRRHYTTHDEATADATGPAQSASPPDTFRNVMSRRRWVTFPASFLAFLALPSPRKT
jgi:hypothetical protein